MQGEPSVALKLYITPPKPPPVLQIVRHTSCALRQALLALALLAAGTQAALPQGWMLQHDGQDGFVSVVFCSAGLGGQTRWLNLSTGEIEERETSADTTESCTFAEAHSAALAIDASCLPAGRGDPRTAGAAFTHHASGSLAHERPPVRAPPKHPVNTSEIQNF